MLTEKTLKEIAEHLKLEDWQANLLDEVLELVEKKAHQQAREELKDYIIFELEDSGWHTIGVDTIKKILEKKPFGKMFIWDRFFDDDTSRIYGVICKKCRKTFDSCAENELAVQHVRDCWELKDIDGKGLKKLKSGSEKKEGDKKL